MPKLLMLSWTVDRAFKKLRFGDGFFFLIAYADLEKAVSGVSGA